MGHTSMSQFHTGWGRFLTAAGLTSNTVENDDVSTKLIIIFIVELGIWVVRAGGNFIRGYHVFDSCLVRSIFW